MAVIEVLQWTKLSNWFRKNLIQHHQLTHIIVHHKLTPRTAHNGGTDAQSVITEIAGGNFNIQILSTTIATQMNSTTTQHNTTTEHAINNHQNTKCETLTVKVELGILHSQVLK